VNRPLFALLLSAAAAPALAAEADPLALDAGAIAAAGTATLTRTAAVASPLEALAMQRAPKAEAPLVQGGVPAVLTPAQRTTYRAVFAAIRGGRWDEASAGLGGLGSGPLQDVATAELILAKGSPRAEGEAIAALLARAPELPQAPQLARLAASRGVAGLPTLPVPRDLVTFAGAPRRGQARTILAAQIVDKLRPMIKEDRPADAEALVASYEASLTPEALTELRQRVAWSYYLTGDDTSARRVAALARTGSGEWTVQADWVAGLAAWRQGDMPAAGDAFDAVSRRAGDADTMAAGLFWSARADMGAGHPERVQKKLRTAARMTEAFYGLIAQRALGIAPPPPAHGPGFIQADWTTLANRPNIRAAAALTEIGEIGLADQFLRHQARIGDVRDHAALLRVAARLGLPATQIWLSRNGPVGADPGVIARYPSPSWTPGSGWRVDRNLVFAHALQESGFRTDAVSRAGARGLMQVLPGTVPLIARSRGIEMAGDLSDPSFNIDCGQSFLERLRDSDGVAGLLPKVIAAYNAGPGVIPRWNGQIRDGGDPLLWIESIPYVETRGYVALVLRNYWMYEQQAGERTRSLDALAQGLWPKFPGMSGPSAMRMDKVGRLARAD
jgi:soluble lytic murein transglycosylase